MSGTSPRSIPWQTGLSWLAGPLFDKELRVSSRRRRLYGLRFGYICLFGVVLVYAWFMVARPGRNTSAVVQASRMSEVGKIITAAIVWFQFVAAQILAAVLLSGAIATEIRHRTLDVLFTTPVSNAQIVMGKLLSGLTQMGLLLGISLPLLAIIRVFGGVPWDFLICGLCLTLSTAVLVAALSLWLGITNRQAQQVAMNAVALCGVFWFTSGILLSVLTAARQVSNATASMILGLTNPYAILGRQTAAMLRGSGAGPGAIPWFIYCLIVLAGAGALLLFCIWRLRSMATSVVARPSGSGGASVPARQVVRGRTTSGWLPWRRRQAIRPVKGSPIVWKELCRPRLARNRRGIVTVILIGIAVVLGIASLVALIYLNDEALVPICMGLAYIAGLLFLIEVASSAAGAIPREKESRAWPILLATPLSNGEIVRGKAIAAIRRNLLLLVSIPVLGLTAFLFSSVSGTFGHVFYSSGMSAIHLVGSTVFLVGLGLYVGTKAKTTTAAVVTTLGTYFITRIAFGFLYTVGMMAAGEILRSMGRDVTLTLSIVTTILSTLLYAGMGLLFARLAAGRLRRNVFS